MAKREALLSEIQRRLIQLGVPEDVRHSVIALVRDGIDEAKEPDAPSFAVRVARAFYKTTLRATETLGASSVSMLIMLFDLFVAHEQGRPISVSSLCVASGAASTTALRQIGQLEQRGFVVREEDHQDRRRCWVRPTEKALELVRSLTDEWMAVLCA